MAGEWMSQLRGDLQTNEAITAFKDSDISGFADGYLANAGKLKEYEGKTKELEEKLSNSIVKLPENATDEERDVYLMELGRPEKSDQYEWDGQDKSAPEWVKMWKQNFFSLGLSADQAKKLASMHDNAIQALINAHNENVKKEAAEAGKKLRQEWGVEYDANEALAKRMWAKYGEGDFDKAFDAETNGNRFAFVRMLFKLAKLTGEDKSPPGRPPGSPAVKPGIVYDKSPQPHSLG